MCGAGSGRAVFWGDLSLWKGETCGSNSPGQGALDWLVSFSRAVPPAPTNIPTSLANKCIIKSRKQLPRQASVSARPWIFLFSSSNSDFWRESSTWQAAGESVWVTAATSDHGLAPFPTRDGWANGNKGSRRVNKALLQKPNKELMEWNDNGELSNNILWDVSKTVISGKLIQP